MRGIRRTGGALALLLASVPAGAQAPPEIERTLALPTGIELRYAERGAPDAETVVVLHGYTDSRLSFLTTIDALLERRPDLRILSIDLRGHGGSSLPPAGECAPAPERCFRVADFAADVVAFLEALAIERTHIVAHSYGSMVAQDVALAARERIETIILIGTAARGAGNAAIEQFVLGDLLEGSWRPALEARGLDWPADAYAITPLDVDPEVEEWLLANWVTEIAAEPTYLAALAARTARVPLGAWIGVARAFLEWDNVERLGGLEVPVLVLWGSQDGVTTEADQAVLRSALDVAARACRATYVWKRYGREPLPASGIAESDLGHNFQWGAGEQVAADIAAWLADRAPTPDLHYVDLTGAVRTEPGAAEFISSPPCR